MCVNHNVLDAICEFFSDEILQQCILDITNIISSLFIFIAANILLICYVLDLQMNIYYFSLFLTVIVHIDII